VDRFHGHRLDRVRVRFWWCARMAIDLGKTRWLFDLYAPPLRISVSSVLCGSGGAGYVTKVQYPIGPPSNRIKHEIFISLPRLLSHQSLR
jgi:hypothetical protein